MNYTTNRILEIPQDIKLELNNGTLTLKAGSKVYIPNGFEADGTTPKFDTVIVDNDLDIAKTNIDRLNNMVCYRDEEGELVRKWSQWTPEDIYSGLSAPEVSVNSLWYDTTNNLIKEYYTDVKSWKIHRTSFPLCTYNATATAVTSINQVFNGFGYIGSTIFALPGVKCQFADGRNVDGSYKSYVATTTKVLTKTFGSETYNGFDASLSCVNGNITGFAWHVNEDFNAESGYIEINKSGVIQENICPVLRFFINSSADNGKILQFLPKEVDKLNWKTSDISGMSMPSSKYIDLTLGASGTTYTAPANGWFVIHNEVSGNNVYFTARITLPDHGFVIPIWTEGGSIPVRVTVPCRAGSILIIQYNCKINSTPRFRFIYAQGEQ